MLRKVLFFAILYVAAALSLIPAVPINPLTILLAFVAGYAMVISPLDMPALWRLWLRLVQPYDRIIVGKVAAPIDRLPDLHFLGKIEEEL